MLCISPFSFLVEKSATFLRFITSSSLYSTSNFSISFRPPLKPILPAIDLTSKWGIFGSNPGYLLFRKGASNEEPLNEKIIFFINASCLNVKKYSIFPKKVIKPPHFRLRQQANKIG